MQEKNSYLFLSIQANNHCEFKIQTYPNSSDETLSINLREYGIWEGWNTALVLQILTNGDRKKKVFDYGSHIGYYSIMAAVMGYQVYSFDESKERIKMLKKSAKANEVLDNIKVRHVRIDQDNPLSNKFDGDTLFWKCDIDNNDIHAVKADYKLFKQKKIDYALIEISPCMGDSYPELTKMIVDCGYEVYLIPDKLFDKRLEFGANPLETLKKYCCITDNYIDVINSIKQVDFLFIK